MATNNFDKQTEEILALLRNNVSAEEIANNLSAALQAAEKQLAEETKAEEERKIAEEAAKKTEAKEKLGTFYYEEKLKSDLCNCLRNYVSCAHKKTYDRLIEIHGHDFTDDELIKIIDNTIKNTAVAIKLYDIFDSYGNEATITQKLCDNKENANKTTVTNWETLFNDFFDKYNL